MKFLNIVLICFLLILSTSFVSKDNKRLPLVEETNAQAYTTQIHTPWTLSGYGYWTESNSFSIYNDFEYAISRSVNKVNGYYYYDFWFFSQSYYWDGYKQYWAATNLKNVNVYVDGQHVTSDYSTLGITFDGTDYNATTLRFYTSNPQAKIYFKWDYMKAK